MSKKYWHIGCMLALCGLPLSSQAQGGFVGGDAKTAVAISVEQAKLQRDDAPVKLTGHIVRALGDEKYLFRDATGEIAVEIDDEVWRGLTVKPEDTVTIHGEVDKDAFASIEIEANRLEKP